MNDLKQFQNGVNEDGEVVIPFIGGLTYPVRQIDDHIKGFLWLTFVAALFNVVISSFLGRNFLCGLGIEGPGFYCSANVLALGGSVLAFIGGLAWYINRWYSISESGGEIVYKLNLKDVKTVGFILFYLGLWAVAGWAAYSLNIRKPVEDWREELLFFFVFTMIILAIFVLLVNSVLFIRFLQGKKWLNLRCSFWPVFDNLYKILGWFLFYFLVFAYFFRSVTVFWVQNEWFPFWVNSLAGEFCFYFVIYASVAVFISSLAYQAKYIFGNRRQK